MKRKSKGTTLIEIMVSLALISIVLIFVFNILADLKSEDRESTRGAEDSIKRASYTRIIQNDFIMNQLSGVSNCGSSSNTLCFKFSFKKSGEKQLKITENKVIYDNEQWTLESSKYNLDKSKTKFCYFPTGGSNDHLLKIIIPTNLNPNLSRKLDIELTYASDYALTIDGITSFLGGCS